MYSIVYVFFFKQKTAYEMRISDWSSDVCSSDLRASTTTRKAPDRRAPRRDRRCPAPPFAQVGDGEGARLWPQAMGCAHPLHGRGAGRDRQQYRRARHPIHRDRAQELAVRSEEHTSELQSLMRISYAVFCLKKKKKQH